MSLAPSGGARAAGAAQRRHAFSRGKARPWRFSALTRRILALNVVGLVILLAGILYLNQFRAGLIDARIRSLTIQGEIIANAIAQASTADPDATAFDPAIAAQAMRTLVALTQTRAQLYDANRKLVADTRNILAAGQVLSYPLPEPDQGVTRVLGSVYDRIVEYWPAQGLPLYFESRNESRLVFEEVKAALEGRSGSVLRRNSSGDLIVSVAVPVQRFKVVMGALMLSTEAGDIDGMVRGERLAMIEVFLVALIVTILLSLALSATIARPIRRLAETALLTQTQRTGRIAIPDLTQRHDEIGDLSGALRAMTEALYRRLDAIESFAADVSHEIKNPLTSLRSAVETLSRAKTDEQRERLMAIILEDVGRLDRLITDISAASRLDAELGRSDLDPVDLAKLANAVIGIYRETNQADGINLMLSVMPDAGLGIVLGIESRLGQVLRNLIDNALSFSPEGGTVHIILSGSKTELTLMVEDDGPGIPAANLESVFERFYTERPAGEAFGNHSGLGLAICRQIAEAHGGTIRAENRQDSPEGDVKGARFILTLPRA